ncbi:hypothetical protein BJ875DRAFT_545261 [Amylocarpus encephaloides]|uniref:Uncharacterized protein n=1 Tax=Amylocarpus encephaloides TaxID=45428 RepID=A0A9P8C430_9HELO|nr:hypothetical protein BJ875DRAFT_545261 [Amylocarpus encephaloides]
MALPSSIQTLTAAFSFGILLQAAAGALFLYFKGHGSKIFQEARRLVLVLFLLFAALWAQLSFFNLMVTETSSSTCQALLVFTTTFDQLARVAVEQFFLWAMSEGTKTTTQQLVLQATLTIRLIAGGILVGLTRPDFAPVCVAQTSVLPIAITVLALDIVIIGVLMVRAISMGIFSNAKEERKGDQREQGRALSFGLFAFAVWTGTSVPMILGISTIELIVRTVVPSNGLLILVGVMTIFPAALLSKREETTTPEAHSPFMAPTPPTRELLRDGVDNGSPVSGQNYVKNGRLFVVNPSATPRDSPTSRFQPNFGGDARGFTKLSEVSVNPVEENGGFLSSKNGPGNRRSSGVLPSMFAAPLQAGASASVAPAMLAAPGGWQTTPVPNIRTPVAPQKRGPFSWSKSPVKPSVRNLRISNPVMGHDQEHVQPFAKVQTIDLATAAANERERREGAAARSRESINLSAQNPLAMAATEGLNRSISVKRKEPVSQSNELMPGMPTSHFSAWGGTTASTSSASLSPGREEVRRRSPRNTKAFERAVDKPAPKAPLQRTGTIGLPSNPRAGSQRKTIGREPVLATEPTVMPVIEIVYDDPAMVKTIMDTAPTRPKTAGALPEYVYSTGLKSSNSIIHRPRPIRRDSEKDRAIFPLQSPLHHQRSKSGPASAFRKSMLASQPGSPTDLPPLPPPPTKAVNLRRILPNDTKSMTFDEKIELLFPAPPGMPTVPNRRSSVPSIPRVSSTHVSDARLPKSPDWVESRRSSKRTTIASFSFSEANERSLHASQAPKIPEKALDRATYRFSANTYRNIADEVGETWIPGIAPSSVNAQDTLRQSQKPTAYDGRKSVWTESSQEDTTSYWGSVHSEMHPVDLSVARQKARSTFVQRGKADDSKTLPPVPPLDYNDQEEAITVMLDSDETGQPILSEPAADRDSSVLGNQRPTSIKLPSSQVLPIWHRRIGDELPTFSERRSNVKARKLPPPTPLLLNNSGRQAKVVVHTAEPDSPERAIQEIQAQLKRLEEPNRGSVDSLIRPIPSMPSVENDNASERFRLLENLEKEMGLQEDQWQQMHNNFDRDSISVMTPQASIHSDSDLSRHSSMKSSRAPSRANSRRNRIQSGMTVRSKGDDTTSPISPVSSDNSRASIWQQRLAEAQVEYLEKAPALLRKKSLNFLSLGKSHQILSPTPPESVNSETDQESDSEAEHEDSKIQPAFGRSKSTLWEQAVQSPKGASGRMWNPPYEPIVSRAVNLEPPARDLRPTQRPIASTLVISSSGLWSKPCTPERKRPVVGLWGSKPVRPTSIVTRKVTQRPQRKSRRVTFLPDIVESPVPLPNKRDTLGIYRFPWGEKSDTAVYQPALNQSLELTSMVNAKLLARSEELEPNLDEYSQSYFDDYDEEAEDSSDMDADSDDDFDETTLWEIANLLQSTDVPSKNSLLPPSRQLQWSSNFSGDDRSDEIEEMTSEEHEKETGVAQEPVMKLPIQPLARTSRDASLLWIDNTANVDMANTGLPLPDASMWSSLIRTTGDAMRSGPRSTKPLPAIQSDNLWIAPIADTPRPDSAILWQSKSVNVVNGTATNAKPLMWEPQAKMDESRHSGLFVFQMGSLIIRSTDAAPVAASVANNPRPSNGALLKLSSSSMWSPQQTQNAALNWISASNSHHEHSQLRAKTWAPAEKVMSSTSEGLFQVTKSSIICRTSSLEPAALGMTSKPRKYLMPLSAILSNELWSGCEASLVERDWISESSVRPESPSVYSTTSSGQSSPLSDASSFKSTSTKASSIWGSLRSVSPLSVKPVKTKSASPIEGPRHASKLPLRQLKKLPEESVGDFKSSKIPGPIKTLVSVRESRVLSSRDIFEAKALSLDVVPIKKSQRIVAPVQLKPCVAKPLRHQHRPIVAFRADWDTALTEAIAAGMHKKTFKRMATPADWKAALDTAILASVPRLRRPKAFPVDWRAALKVAVLKSEPRLRRINASSTAWSAALQEAISQSAGPKRVRYDAAVRHPVFFTNNLMSDASQIHPAAFGYCKKTTKSYMWSPTANVRTLDNTALWSAKVYAKQKQGPFLIAHVQVIRGTNGRRSVELPTLKSSALWHKASVKTPRQNWITSHNSKKPHTWTLPTSQAAKPSEGSFLWTRENPKHSVKSSFDVATKPMALKKALPPRANNLPVLASTTLWQSSSTMVVEHNWLIVRGKEAARTWTPKTPISLKVDSHLWSKDRVFDRRAPTQSQVYGSAIVRKVLNETLDLLPVLESTEFWKPLVISTAERNWLMATKKIATQTWTPISRPHSTNSNTNAMLWSKQNIVERNDLPQMTISPERLIRKSASTESVELSMLQSSRLWEQPASAVQKREWMTVETRARDLTWSPRISAPKVSNSGMWTVQEDLTTREENTQIFGHIAHDHIRKPAISPETPLPILASTELFQAQVDTKTAPKNWLHDTSKFLASTSLHMTTSNKGSSWTWTAPVPVASVNMEGVMWRVQPAINSAPLASFSNFHNTPLKRNRKQLSTLESIESSEMWRRSTVIPASPQNWLLKAKAMSSKVEFRY